MLPYLLLAAPAGYLADRFSKREVIVNCKLAEIVIMAMAGRRDSDRQHVLDVSRRRADRLAGGAVRPGQARQHSGDAAAQQDLVRQRPARTDHRDRGRGRHGASAIGCRREVTGHAGQERWWISALVLVGVAMAGWVTSLFIMPLKAANPIRTFPWDMATQTVRDLKILGHDRALLRVALGIMFFWTLAMLVQLNIDQFAVEGSGIRSRRKCPLLLASLDRRRRPGQRAGRRVVGRQSRAWHPAARRRRAGTFAFLLFTVEGELVDPSGNTRSATSRPAHSC